MAEHASGVQACACVRCAAIAQSITHPSAWERGDPGTAPTVAADAVAEHGRQRPRILPWFAMIVAWLA
jgi:hypothetical protein